MLVALLLACHTSPPATSPEGPAPQAPAEAAAPAVKDIGVTELKSMMDAGPVTLIDVRTTKEFAEGHVPGAVNIPVDEVEARASEIPSDGEVVLICRSGGRSAKAAEQLSGQGYTTINVEGGTLAWIEAGYAVE